MVRVLVVDDDPNVRFTVRVALEGSPPSGQPMAVVEAANGVEALQATQHDTYDLVLLDIMMPGLDGFAVLHALRQHGDDPPVVMLTARGREVDIVNAFRAGADGYVTKPFDVDELAYLVADLTGREVSERRAMRVKELERAELLLQLEHGFGAEPPETSNPA
ncbi:MAG: response regulator [Actinomycetota bacterium]|uniref:response regulator transcription factor n=1 Tax=Euzebya pacifica TaxID=1608957 RepID=UPI0030FBA3AE